MIRLLVLAVSLLLFSYAGAGGPDADRGNPHAEHHDKQQHKRAIERHTRDTQIREERIERKDDPDDGTVDDPDDEKGDTAKDKKPQ